MPEKALLIDITKCLACRGCMVACKQWNKLPGESTRNYGSYENPPSLSTSTFTRIIFQEVKDREGVKWLFRKEQCLHCSQAACLVLCPSNALYQNEFGFVEVHNDRCIGCGICQKFCPFKIPRVDRAAHKAVKCTLCPDRVAQGKHPACAKTCPTGTLRFGDREAVIALAHQLLGESQDKRKHLYGEEECGGLHVLYLLPDHPSTFGLPERPKMPNPFEAYTFLRDSLRPSPLREKILALAARKYFGHGQV
jgi:formate dehydrogenase beta subunit